ncbi:MAG: ATPase domain-containing protein [Candidatus Altiarchaeota archaeon]
MVDLNERCPTGIDGLDELIDGGFPRGRTMLLAGTCGTGKTTFAVQYLVNGIQKYGEAGVFVTLEQNSDEIRSDMKRFGMDIKKLEDEGKLVLIDTSLSKIGLKDFVTSLPITPQKSFSLLPGEFDMEKVIGLAVEAGRKIKAKRIAIDSLPALNVLVDETQDIRRMLVNINSELKSNKLTTVIITEMREEDGISKYDVEEYISDGVMIVRANEALDTRTFKVRKMRVTKHSLKPHTLDFNDKGVYVKTMDGRSII